MSEENESSEEMETIEQELLADILKAQPNQVLQSSKKTINLQGGVVQKQKVSFLYLASCGHLIHDVNEIGGKCQVDGCDSIVCKSCARVCERCRKLLCPKHQKMHDGKVYCSRCKIIVMLLGGLVDRKRTENEPSLSQRLGKLLVGSW